jgi:glutamine amidotransferase-like uncharacterized protein
MKETVAIFVHDPACEVECALAMEAALESKFEVKLFGIEDLDPKFLSNIDILAFPGGIGDSDQFDEIFGVEHIDAVRNFVNDGGRYLGICMGAYWAGSYYFDILHGIEPVQYISQLDADVLTDEPTLARVYWNGQEEDMYFYDGCAFVGNLSFTDIVATYGNGDAMAVYQNRVGLIGCHPESEEWWYEYDEMDGWHEGHHNELLCEFVEGL